EKCQNHEISKKRIFVENVMGAVKYFKILARRYRNRRKRFGLRFNLMAGIYHFEFKV
ncbi:MAG: IS5/IS1182 family transposase, partial [Streptococcaceae bacterium]|nr:IS5/IS1182 family transposase [Streptococcaceae bacterium]